MDDAATLRGAGLRVTAARLAILDAVRTGNHLDAEHIAHAVRGRVGHVSTQAVYDGLHALTDTGLVRRIEPAGSPARYETRVGDNHHHLVCRLCKGVTDIDCVAGAAPCLEPSQSHGYLIDEAEVVFWGVCPDCRSGTGEAPNASEPSAVPRG
ncbi:Fur family transcriptional regulator [Nocardiopsis ansamitocini]|uniref:Transcriptional repressor n=1 Tax=Nocardiopsis ansamitocini TaxID=1670832 RepID=A0A9W6P542_9ACTN|nr:Fur family transcriptional regulator [Nocardiopsis ansamitocini]GLU47244.1 transcriptional repressor [Nocardiopsis ansamitocini]